MTVPELGAARRLVVKIGSALIAERATGRVKSAWLAGIADDIAALRKNGTEVIAVSSGAIALAQKLLGFRGRPRLEEQQAAAAVGQIRLAQAWSEALSARGIVAAQLLLTLGDTEDRRRYLNARATLATLIGVGAVPVINENDSVATSEIRFGDNDRLAARVAAMMAADQLVLLSDVDGLYTADPRRDPGALRVPVVAAITPEIEAMAGGAGSGVGGMRTKLAAAKIATAAGCAVAIARGTRPAALAALADGAEATWFLPAPEGAQARKRWIAGGLKPLGVVVVDRGAARALGAGGSLLPAGVREVIGAFARGDPVVVRGPDGNELARGLSAYGAADARRIAGHRSHEIAQILGWRGRDELVHRDDLALSAAVPGAGDPGANDRGANDRGADDPGANDRGADRPGDGSEASGPQ
ncbi:MAG: glutamate 5-kinase [Acetobacteraceae bacterium]